MSAAAPPPVTILTGFLGAGKTTLLGRLLRRPELARTAILINEVGAIAIDHHLVRDVRGDAVILGSGCVCCTVAGDLVRALTELAAQVARGEVPPFERALIETTGLADPTGVIAALVQVPHLARLYRAGAVVTAVDGLLGAATLARQPEAVAQVALADRLIITKTDVAAAADVAALEALLRSRNLGAPILHSAGGEIDPDALLAPAPGQAEGGDGLAGWLEAASASVPPAPGGGGRPAGAIHGFITTFTVQFGEPVRMGPLGLWLSLMTQMHGGALLRVKGLVDVQGEDAPVVIDCVQHVVHPARQLPAWPDADRRTRLVFIARGLAAGTIASLRQSLAETLDQPLIG
jgi:G3E family GTPase